MSAAGDHPLMLNARRPKRPRRTLQPSNAPPDGAGQTVVMASVEEVMAALEGVDLEQPWAALRHQVIPVLPRWRPLPRQVDDPVTRQWPPGLETQFGLDIGPAFLYIGSWALGHWGVTPDELAEQAVANVRDKVTGRRHHPLIVDSIGGMPLTAFQSRDGWASTLLLVPDLLMHIFGTDPALVLAPMRDLVIQIPIDADPELATWILEEFSSQDPNGLAVPVLALMDGRLSFLPPIATARSGRSGRRH